MAVSRNMFIQHIIKKQILPLTVKVKPARKLHRDIVANNKNKSLIPEKNQTKKEYPVKRLNEKKNETDEPDKKIEYKDWKLTDTSWLGKNHTESELVKHIEILQRFSERYNSVVGNRPHANKTNIDSQKKVKMMTKPSTQSYSTIVKRKPSISTKPQSKSLADTRTYITLANEPDVPPRKKPVVPKVLDLPNPDSIRLESPKLKLPQPRLYSIVSKWDKKDKEIVPPRGRPKLEDRGKSADTKKGKKTVQPFSDFFLDRYNPRTIAEKKIEKKIPENSTKDLTQNLKETLVETRKTTKIQDKGIEPPPMKTPPVLVKQSHMPLEKCPNMDRPPRNARRKQSFDRASSTSQKSKCPPCPTCELLKNNIESKNNIINKLINYFKR